MMDLNLNYSLIFEDLYDTQGLIKLDAYFLAFLDEDLKEQLLHARQNEVDNESELLLALASHLEDFLSEFFGISKEILKGQEQIHHLAPLFTCKRQFIQRMAAKAYTNQEIQSFNSEDLYHQLEALIHSQFQDLDFAKSVLGWIAENKLEALQIAKKYAAWQLHQPHSSELFRLPQKKDYDNLVHTGAECHRDGFNCTTPPVSEIYALEQSNYCIWCHHQGKDSCSKGLKVKGTDEFQTNPLGVSLEGCPLGQKISEMNELRAQGYAVGALAVVMIDNPMVAGTGHRICNDCMTACIYQKQDPVDIPSIESETLQHVLRLPWGFEIYSLLSRWNPLNFKRPLPKEHSGYKVLVAGMGPAGFTLAHHLLQEGHQVVGIDGLKIEPLPESLQGLKPICDIQQHLTPLSERIVGGFGGVAEYGITARWDKNNLTLIRLLLERRTQFSLYGGVRLGGTLTLDQAFDEYGFDHVALCLGAGKPKLLEIPEGLPRGVRMASDFLMALQLTGADKMQSLANLEVRLPIVVVGGGLTAIDAATEALAYYPLQVERFLRRHEILGVQNNWSPEERKTAATFIDHAHALRAERQKAQAENRPPELVKLLQSWGGCTLVYRKPLQESPAYRLNAEEIGAALAQGIYVLEDAQPQAFLKDDDGHLSHLEIKKGREFISCPLPSSPRSRGSTKSANGPMDPRERGDDDVGDNLSFSQTSDQEINLPAGTALLALGTGPNTQIASEEKLPIFQGNFAAENEIFISRAPNRSISYLGDVNPHFSGSVVKAMASAQKAYPAITKELSKIHPKENQTEIGQDLTAHVVTVNRLTRTILEVVVKAPLAARNFKPGQFFRFQNFESYAEVKNETPLAMEGLALTGASADAENGTLSLIILEMGGSSNLCSYLKPGEPVILMGPTGTPTEIFPHKNVLLIGGGLGNAVLFSIGKALKEAGSKVLYVAGYKTSDDRFKVEDIEAASDQVIWCCEDTTDWQPSRPHDLIFQGNVIEALENFATNPEIKIPLLTIDHIIAIGSDRMMAAVARARDGNLKPYLRAHHTAIGSINSPMQCMMKSICAQCLQAHTNPETGEVSYVFSCVNQDQYLERVDFDMLHERLGQNSLSEKQTKAWIANLGVLLAP